MVRKAAFVAILTLAACCWGAGEASAEGENGRFGFTQVPDGFLRLDRATGHVSLCGRRDSGWACRSVPDERAALEAEIARMQAENGALRDQLLARNPPPGGDRSEPLKTEPPKADGPAADPSKPRAERELRVPSDAELERVIGFMEKAWRRLLDMVEEMKDRDKKG